MSSGVATIRFNIKGSKLSSSKKGSGLSPHKVKSKSVTPRKDFYKNRVKS